MQRRNGKLSRKKDETYVPDQTDEEALDHIISDLEQNLENNSQNNSKNKKKRTSTDTSTSLNIKDFEINESKEDGTKSTKRQKTQPQVDIANQEIVKVMKAPKVWSVAESALLKILLLGCSPIGRNIAGMIFLFSFFSFFFFLFFLFFLIIRCIKIMHINEAGALQFFIHNKQMEMDLEY